MLDTKRISEKTLSLSFESFIKEHPQFQEGFTRTNLEKGITEDALLNHLDHRLFLETLVIPLPIQENEKAEFDFNLSSFSKEMLGKEITLEQEIYALGTLFLLAVSFVDIENCLGKPIGVLLQSGKIAVLSHNQAGRCVEVWTCPTNDEYYELTLTK